MDIQPIHRIAVKQIAPPRAEKFVGETGIKFDLVIGTHNDDASYWTNNAFEVVKDGYDWKKGDTVVVIYQAAAEAFGSYSDKKGYDLGQDIEGEKIYFFKPEEIQLTIRNEQIIAPRGKCIVTQVAKKPVTSAFIIPDQAKEEYERDLYDVIAVGEATPEHKLNKDSSRMTLKVLTEAIPNIGDRVIVQKNRGYPMEAPLNKKLDKNYWLVGLEEIMGVWNQ